MKLTSTNKYSDAMLETYIFNLENELTSHSEIQGRQNGAINKPVTEPEYRAYDMNFVETKIQTGIDYNYQINTPISGMLVAKKILTEAKEKVKTLNAALCDEEHKLRPLEEHKKSLAPDLKKRLIRRLVAIGIIILSIAEGYFAYEAFRHIPISKVPAFFAAIGIAIAIGFGTHFILGRFIQRAKTKIQKLIRYTIVVIPAFIGFLTLGQMRAHAYTDQVNLSVNPNPVALHINEDLTALSLTIISFFLFIIALLLAVRFSKTDEESKQEQEYDRTCKEVNDCKLKMQQLRREIDNIEKETKEKAAEALQRYEYAMAVENRLLAIARHSMEVYKDSNLRHRKDDICPEFFSYPPPFKFKLFFQNSTMYHNEKNSFYNIA